MNRREFSGSLLLASGAWFAPGATLAESPAQVSPRARALYRRALILDCNSAPPLPDHLPMAQADLDLVRDSGVNVVKLSLGGINANFADTVAEIGQVLRVIEVHPRYFTQVRVPPDLMRAKRSGLLGIILSFESAEMFAGKVENFEVFRNLGVRVMQLSYNRRSPFAAGVMEPEGGGLTALGRDAVKEMNRLGIAIDLSHANAATTADVLEVSTQPPIMTHTGAAAVHAHPRLKSDEQLRALAAKGGVGIGSDVGLEPFDTSAQGMAEFQKQLDERKNAGLSAPEE